MINVCPICGGQLEAERTEYLINPVLDDEGELFDHGDSWPSMKGGVYGDTKVYCENNHSHEQIISEISK